MDECNLFTLLQVDLSNNDIIDYIDTN